MMSNLTKLINELEKNYNQTNMKNIVDIVLNEVIASKSKSGKEIESEIQERADFTLVNCDGGIKRKNNIFT